MIYTLTLNPSFDHHITVDKLIKSDKLTAETVRVDVGGKGINVARVVEILGGEAKAFTIIDAEQGKKYKTLLNKENINGVFAEVLGRIRTNLKITDRTDQSHVQINEPGPRLSSAELARVLTLVQQAKPRPSYWVLAGSLPPGVPDGIYENLIRTLQQRGERCVLDADGKPLKLGIKARPFMVKPNEFELERLMGTKLRTRAQLIAAGRKLAETIPIVAITLGKRGSVVIAGNEAWALPTPAVKVRSEVGAGDAFVGGFLFSLDRGEDIKTASRWAAAAAWASVITEGTARPARRDVMRLMAKIKPDPTRI